MLLTDTQRQALLWLAVAAAAWWGVSLLAPVLLPFVLAAVMAYALRPVVDALARRRVPRWLGAGVAIALLMLLLLAVVLIIVPVVTQQWPLLREQIPPLLERLNAALVPLAQRHGLDIAIDVEGVRALLRRLISGHEGQLLDQVLASLRIGGSALLAVLGNLVLMPVVAYYLLLDWSAVVARVLALVPPRWRLAVDGLAAEVDAVLGQYLRGQLLVMGALAVFYTAGLALVGLKLALPIGVFTGLAVFVPYLGFGLGLVLALLAAVLQFQSLTGVLLVGAVYAAGQVIESFFLTPRLVGERIGLHPIAVIFALMAFGHLFGFVGVLIALPASAVLLVAVRRLQALYVSSPWYRLREAAPPRGED
ncbi:sporulation integral membrane protein YtvI [Tepidimonas thermarum]|uniref:Sporulation integral membrane protein YtvI n=1 Tax=Tepidimonas thermarum TaxID=335431 RepID=A0A554X706_9BURK|nr:AI-2E family transporter [Tepidimonas thermarum]TSE31615.1 sporulation integral membrane protein YtvI [Tepidimonas thermarum]